MPRRNLDSRLAIVTGASGGIGREIALELARHRARLILSGRRADALQSVAREVSGLGASPATVIVGDITDQAVCHRLVEAVQLAEQPLDILVNNAGISAFGAFREASPDRLGKILSVNLLAAAQLTRHALPLLLQSNDPVIVNVGSILAYLGIPFNSEYCASKAALRSWTQSLRAELSAQGIDVMLVTPGTTDTGFFDHLIEQRGEIPWGNRRGVSPQFVARKTVAGIVRRRREVIPGWQAKAYVRLARHMPGLMERIMRRYVRD